MMSHKLKKKKSLQGRVGAGSNDQGLLGPPPRPLPEQQVNNISQDLQLTLVIKLS